jgi:hypothetical protein
MNELNLEMIARIIEETIKVLLELVGANNNRLMNVTVFL